VKRLVWLYPRLWRRHYQGEMEDLLESSSPRWRDAVDLVRGAMDAHLHPQIDGSPRGSWQVPLALAVLVISGVVASVLLQLLDSPRFLFGAPIGFLAGPLLLTIAALVSRRLGVRLATWFFALIALRYIVSFALFAAFLITHVFSLLVRLGGNRMVGPGLPLHVLLLNLVLVLLWACIVAVLLRRSGVSWPVAASVGLGLEVLTNQVFWQLAGHPLSAWYWQLVSTLQQISGHHDGFPALALLVGLEALATCLWAALLAAIVTRKSPWAERVRPTSGELPVPPPSP
jgi:hypothetical protein